MFESLSRFRQKLADETLCVGVGVTLADPTIVEALAPLVDFFWIDLEHTHLGYETLVAHLIAARAGGAAALVRVRGSEIPWIKPVLDIGASGVIVPQIRSADEARRVVDACRYPPLGRRGFGPRRASDYGRLGGPEYLRLANEQLFVVVQIETREAVEELDAILDIDGLDSVAIGPRDLALSLRGEDDPEHPEVVAAIETVTRRARDAGKFVGIGLHASAVHARRAAECGVNWVQCGDDYGYLLQGVAELLGAIRAG